MTDPILSPRRAAAIGKVISDLRSRFVSHDGYLDLTEQFDLLLYRRRADLAAGRQPEARGIVLIGGSGSGKSTALQRLFRRHPDLKRLERGKAEADLVSFLVPSPATLKSVGLSCLKGLGYPLRRDRSAAIIWDLVQSHLREHRILFMHLDEMQDLLANRSQAETQSVVNTLKSLMQNAV
jgi:ABC-type dipeptide/oligopeptide/nickel transport system ATPase component